MATPGQSNDYGDGNTASVTLAEGRVARLEPHAVRPHLSFLNTFTKENQH